ncbi:MAG: hypothetical protein RIG27_05640 [Coleofasciculus sp. F4-SAH-05]
MWRIPCGIYCFISHWSLVIGHLSNNFIIHYLVKAGFEKTLSSIAGAIVPKPAPTNQVSSRVAKDQNFSIPNHNHVS